MTVTGDERDPELAAATRREIARLRAMGALGESGRLRELFDFLVERSGDAAPPKEVEIAVSVFGKADAETLKDDPVARVYVHRLRKRLDDFYRREGAPEGVRLDVPRGQYRIVGVRAGAAEAGPEENAETAEAEVQGRRQAAGRRWAVAAAIGIAAMLALNLAVWALLRPGGADASAAHPVWAAMDDPSRPALVVVGDYYMFGELENGMFLRRLVRDFSINSREELLRLRLQDPEAADRYTDVNLQYLPVSVAFALSRIMPAAPEGKPVRVALASQLTADMIRDNDILYVGLFSGLSLLRDPVFAESRFAIGESYDEVIDAQTGETYVSEGFTPGTYEGMYRDYGFFSSFEGPAGNRIVIVAGARDAGVTGVAERVAGPGALRAFDDATGGAASFEALFEVEGQQNISLDARLLAAAPLDGSSIWSAQNRPRAFPSE